jgi:hypothetical protein
VMLVRYNVSQPTQEISVDDGERNASSTGTTCNECAGESGGTNKVPAYVCTI